MLAFLIESGADPRVERDGESVLDAPAREGCGEMVRMILRAAPELATEERALMAADHPEAERVIREVARGDAVDSLVAHTDGLLHATRVSPRFDPPAPAKKGAQRFYVPSRAREEQGDAIFAGPGGGVLAFGARTRWIRDEREIVFEFVPGG